VLNQDGADRLTEPFSVKDNFAEQTVVMVRGKVALENEKVQREIFGPFTVIVKCPRTRID